MTPGGDPRLERLLDQALRAYRAGRTEEIEARCGEALALNPGNPTALQLLGLAAQARGDLERSESLLRQAVAGAPQDGRLINTLGAVLAERGAHDEAIARYREALALDPDNAKAHSNLGNSLLRQGRPKDAMAAYRRALAVQPDNAKFHFNLGNCYRALGRRDEAIESYRRCLSRDERFAAAHVNLGSLLLDGGETEEAEQASRRALDLDPRSVEALANLGIICARDGRLDDAEGRFRAALEIDPDHAGARYALASLLDVRGRKGAAEAELARLFQGEPTHLAANVLRSEQLKDEGRWAEALAVIERAHEAHPNSVLALSLLVSLLQRTCSWDALARCSERLDALAGTGDFSWFPAEPPHLTVARSDDPALNARIQQAWGGAIERRMASARAGLGFEHRREPRGRLTVGYLSRDFRDHPVGHLVRTLFAAHDPARVRVHGYSYGPDDGSDYRRDIAETCERFVDLSSLDHQAAARRIHDDDVDVLVDLGGHTRMNRLEICALRPAPVQATYLGFAGGIGASFIDYLIADRVVTPPEVARHYREALVCLPHCFQVNDRQQPIAEQAVTRRHSGLPDGAFVFASFNQAYKIDPVMFGSWMRILAAVPGSVLWLSGGGLAADNLRRAAAQRSIDPARLLFAERVPGKDQHLRRLQLADLALDTRIYNGHATTSDCLWAGLPVLTLAGRHYASRVSASVLQAVGLPELITTGADDFEARAIDLAGDRDRLAALRARLWANRLSAPLFDTVRFARDLERAYARMWETYAAGGPPQAIMLDP